ncbi:hypothetical protein FIBSPDRAFT_894363 [Athelia psychrophila]|uniref:Uncharacterized protein n=1 Tax=Athelia psychrophila TaxID=1759441 RepID=A0A166FWL0_9AGAM|nr:hypothetical protein FIBSPDRAFT_959311 [Fibularhizoctonia sp. CBS 109695]KZP17240.1 hypothetical protein FIBSPDRAFT_894363 [Fibularhizoctonia sp. CBS 109695]
MDGDEQQHQRTNKCGHPTGRCPFSYYGALGILVHRPGCCDTCKAYMDHITVAEFDSDESLKSARGKDGMEKHWVPRRKYKYLKESYEEKVEGYRENISDMRVLRDDARRLVEERDREIAELRERLSVNDRQATTAPRVVKRQAGEWAGPPPVSKPSYSSAASTYKRKKTETMPMAPIPPVAAPQAPRAPLLPGTVGGPTVPSTPPSPPRADPYAEMSDEGEYEDGTKDAERALRGRIGMILAARREVVTRNGEIPSGDPRDEVQLEFRTGAEAGLVQEYLQEHRDWPMLDFMKKIVSEAAPLKKGEYNTVQGYLKVSWRAPPWAPTQRWDPATGKTITIINPAPRPPTAIDIVSRKVAAAEGLATEFGPLPAHWASPGTVTADTHPSLVVVWVEQFYRGDVNIPLGLLNDDNAPTHAHARGWLRISPLIRGISDQTILKAILTLIGFQRYAQEVTSNNLVINETPSFDALSIGTAPTAAQAARALADAGLSIKEAVDAIDYAQSWMRMRSQRTRDDAAAQSLLRHFETARTIPRATPYIRHIPYVWSEASLRWRPAQPETEMEVDPLSLTSGGSAHPAATGTAGGNPADNTDETPAVEATDDTNMEHP